jgi:hypothetical protein
MDKLLIAIPSYARASFLAGIEGTLDYMSEDALKDARLFVRHDDPERALYAELIRMYGVQIEWIQEPVRDYRETVSFILEYALQNKYTYLFLMDDDLKLTYRNIPDVPNKWIKQDGATFDEMTEALREHCDEAHPLIGIHSRGFSVGHVTETMDNAFISQLKMFYLPHFATHPEHCFSAWTEGVCEDYWMQLTLLKAGYTPLVLNRYTRDDRPGADGGCSLNRTNEIQARAVNELVRLFPELVSAVYKNGLGLGETLNPKITWSKARELWPKRQ